MQGYQTFFFVEIEIWGAVYHSVLGKRSCTAFQGATVVASIQTYGILMCPWALTWDTTVCYLILPFT